MAVSTRADLEEAVAVVVVIAEATAIGMVETVAVHEEAVRVVAVSVVEVVEEAVAAVVARNVKEIGPVESAAIKTLPGETSVIGVRLRRVMAPLEAEAVVVEVSEAEEVVEDRLGVAHVTAAEAVVVVSAAIAMEDLEAAVVVPCVEMTEIVISDNGRTKPG